MKDFRATICLKKTIAMMLAKGVQTAQGGGILGSEIVARITLGVFRNTKNCLRKPPRQEAGAGAGDRFQSQR